MLFKNVWFLGACAKSCFSFVVISPVNFFLHIRGLRMRIWREIDFLVKHFNMWFDCVSFMETYCWIVDMCKTETLQVMKAENGRQILWTLTGILEPSIPAMLINLSVDSKWHNWVFVKWKNRKGKVFTAIKLLKILTII